MPVTKKPFRSDILTVKLKPHSLSCAEKKNHLPLKQAFFFLEGLCKKKKRKRKTSSSPKSRNNIHLRGQIATSKCDLRYAFNAMSSIL